MPLNKQIAAHASRRVAKTRHFRIIKDLLIWNNAWREYYRLQNLDADALRDMGLTEASRASVTVTRIAARMRA